MKSSASGMPTRRRAAQLDPEAQALLRYLNLVQRASATQAPEVKQMRRRWKVLALALGRRTPVAAIEHRRIDGPAGPLQVRLYRPTAERASSKPLPVFLWFHGGGFVMGGVSTADSICRAIAERSGAVVVTAQYRLAPEHGLRAGRDDSLAVYDWVVREADALGIDASRTAVGGDSAGGNLAAVLAQRIAQRCKQRGQQRRENAMRLQVLVYPATNLRDAPASRAENAQGYLLTAANIAWFETQFAAGLDTADPLVSPALATDLHGLPPALLVGAGFDPIRDDGLAYAGLLRAAGVPVQLLHYGGQFHGFVNFDAVLRTSRDALDRIGDALAGAFAGEAAADCTIEIGSGGRIVPALFGGVLRDAVVGGLMLAERTEQARNALVGSVMPTAARGWLAHPVWNPASQLRSVWVSALAPLEARQTHGAAAREMK
jgi:acetyl esterase